MKLSIFTVFFNLLLPLYSGSIEMFDGRSLAGWEKSRYLGSGEIRVEDAAIYIGRGIEQTGIRWTGDVYRCNYEISLEARRIEGNDFFCGLSFPVRHSYCSLIVGGWGGRIVGLSSIDMMDAAENETTVLMDFEPGRWYRIRLKVTGEKVLAWMDGDLIIDVSVRGRQIATRVEVEGTLPLGIMTWKTAAGLRNIKLRSLEQDMSSPGYIKQMTEQELFDCIVNLPGKYDLPSGSSNSRTYASALKEYQMCRDELVRRGGISLEMFKSISGYSYDWKRRVMAGIISGWIRNPEIYRKIWNMDESISPRKAGDVFNKYGSDAAGAVVELLLKKGLVYDSVLPRVLAKWQVTDYLPAVCEAYVLFNDIGAAQIVEPMYDYSDELDEYFDDILKIADNDKKLDFIRALGKSQQQSAADYLRALIKSPRSDILIKEAEKALSSK